MARAFIVVCAGALLLSLAAEGYVLVRAVIGGPKTLELLGPLVVLALLSLGLALVLLLGLLCVPRAVGPAARRGLMLLTGLVFLGHVVLYWMG